jgi:hypothetical protein
MKRYDWLAPALGALLLGCGATTTDSELPEPEPDPAPQPADEINAENRDEILAESLETLRALEVFEVGELITGLPENAFHCYGLCPEFEEPYHAAIARVAAFAAAAAEAVATPSEDAACPMQSVEANLSELSSLEIVDVGAFLAAEPANNPSCYNLPCGEDIAAAEATNCDRADKLARIAAGTRTLVK